MQVGRIYRTNQTLFQLTLSLVLLVLLVSGCSQQRSDSVSTEKSVLPVADASDLPEVIQSLLSQSDSQYLDSHFSAALATLERALRINPRLAEVWSRMAQIYLQQGDIEQARQHAKRSNSVVKNNSQLKAFNNKIIELNSTTLRAPSN